MSLTVRVCVCECVSVSREGMRLCKGYKRVGAMEEITHHKSSCGYIFNHAMKKAYLFFLCNDYKCKSKLKVSSPFAVLI